MRTHGFYCHTMPIAMRFAMLSASGADAMSGAPGTNERGRALISAAAKGDVQAVKRLLEDGAGVDASDERGVTALIEADGPDRAGAENERKSIQGRPHAGSTGVV